MRDPSPASGRAPPVGHWPGGFDDADRLLEAARAALDPSGSGAVEIVDRQRNPYGSTISSEVLRCRLRGPGDDPDDARIVTALAKTGPAYVVPQTGHRRGVPYESEIYRRVLPLLPVARPRLLGTFQEPGPEGVGWLFVEYFADAAWTGKNFDPAPLRKASSELGVLHAGGRALVERDELAGLNRYHGAYFERWASRWLESTRTPDAHSWVRSVAPRIDEVMALLDGPDLTVIHGEAYPSNVLLRADRAVIVDWESAGIGMGVLDLADLLLGWREEDVREAEAAYVDTCWPLGPPPGFDEAFMAARLHALGRHMNRPRSGGSDPEEPDWTWKEIQAICDRLGIL